MADPENAITSNAINENLSISPPETGSWFVSNLATVMIDGSESSRVHWCIPRGACLRHTYYSVETRGGARGGKQRGPRPLPGQVAGRGRDPHTLQSAQALTVVRSAGGSGRGSGSPLLQVGGPLSRPLSRGRALRGSPTGCFPQPVLCVGPRRPPVPSGSAHGQVRPLPGRPPDIRPSAPR